jgi:hypothetical protein
MSVVNKPKQTVEVAGYGGLFLFLYPAPRGRVGLTSAGRQCTLLDMTYQPYDLILRLENAVEKLTELANETETTLEGARLSGKAEGVRLALSYLREDLRDHGIGS